MRAHEQIIDHCHREYRVRVRGDLCDGINKGCPCLGFVINHLFVESRSPSNFIWPFRVTDEAPISIAMQPRAIAAVSLSNELGTPTPSPPELLFFARVNTPPINGDEHALLLLQGDALSADACGALPRSSACAKLTITPSELNMDRFWLVIAPVLVDEGNLACRKIFVRKDVKC